MKHPRQHAHASWSASKCPYNHIKSHIGRFQTLAKRILIPKTPDIAIAWNWFQNMDKLKLVQENREPLWRKEGIDDRYAFAALVGCILPEFTKYVRDEANDFMRLWLGHLVITFEARMSIHAFERWINAKEHITREALLSFDKAGQASFRLFLNDTFLTWRSLWWNKISQEIKKHPDGKMAIWELAFSLCEKVPLLDEDEKIHWARAIEKKKQLLWIARHLGGWISSFTAEFMRAIEEKQEHDDVIMSNEQIDAFMPRIHLWLQETMKEFTLFSRIADYAKKHYRERFGKNWTELVRSGKVGFSAHFYRFLERHFMTIHNVLLEQWTLWKDLGTMTCPARMWLVDGKNSVQVLSEVWVMPLMKKYYLPWRKKNIPGA